VLTPGPKKNKVVPGVLQILQQQHERNGWSYRRVIHRCGLPRSSVLRWQSNLRHGYPAIRRPGPAKRPLPDGTTLDRQIAGLEHGKHRTLGTTALRASWSEFISRRDFNHRVVEHRRALQRTERRRLQHLNWPIIGAVWAMDEAVYAGCRWNLVCDLASRYRFDLLLAPDLPASRVIVHLQALLERFGAPLVIKRDNGSNLVHVDVDNLLEAYGVIGLTSPPRCPRYNGSVEYAQREIKIVADILTTLDRTPAPLVLALAPQMINAKPRPCLHGDTAEAVFHRADRTFSQTFTLKRRKEIKHWIDEQAQSILDHMTVCNRHTQGTVWRLVTENWMFAEGLVVPVRNNKVSPIFR
jgi:hypothetical protein